ncbi:PAS domain S-box protein [Halalkalibacter alkaliphilus]|uniref:histidine kinase n=1 Tax=Halalkalibacter alkaliphilus TaxID=2917993 RepID=A0A9X2CRN9_9BACI|nr:PAS domain S-box protein [Halalkalibacter alkaliphilus]MCL7746610.1 PAS domain S-box protein [Halalkalibacter alkaliphilus]
MNISETENEILDRITDPFYALDLNGNFTYINTAASRILQQDREKIIGKSVWSVFPETVKLPLYNQYTKALEKQKTASFEMYYPPLKLWFSITAYPSKKGLSVYFQDITKQKHSVLNRESHYESLFENNPDAVYSFDLDGNFLRVNPAMEQLVGYDEEELCKISYIPLILDENLEQTNKYFMEATRGITQNYETKIRHKNGNIIDLKVTNMPIIIGQEIVGVYGIAKDISNQKRTEKLLFESEKLTAVGQLAASIAHEIRNPLTSIKGFLQLIKSTVKEVRSDFLDIMSDEITRIEMITSELLVLAKPQALDFQYEDLNRIIEDVVMLLSSQALINNVEVITDIEDLPNVKCIGSQLKQVFINLIKNSIEAMPNGGEVVISAKLYNSKEILIQVVDQGSGIPNEFLSKIGTPFYTTKEKGTGLGLMTALKIIDSHSGKLEISSLQNKGTTIEIYLPVEAEAKTK